MPNFKSSAQLDSQAETTLPKTGKKFYGWWIVLAGTAIGFVASGIGFYGHGVILDPLRNMYGWSKGTISSAVTLYFITSGIMGVIIGRQIDRYGPKWIFIIGSVTFGTSLACLTRIDTEWQLYALYFIMALGFSGTSLIPINTLITNWFIQKRGFAKSLANTGLSAGGFILVPFATYTISRWGLELALPVLGTIYGFVVIISTSFIKRRPSDINQFPDGISPPPASLDNRSALIDMSTQMQEWTRSQTIRTAAFWSIVVAFLLALAGQIAFLVHQISFLSQFLGTSGAATAVSVTTGASIVGRLWLGTFVDRYDKRYVIMMCFLIQGIAIITLAHYHHVVILYLGTLAFGLIMGNIVMMQSLIIGECFGLISFATVSGMVSVFTMSGAAFGPGIAGFIFDATRSYQMAFDIFAAMSVIAILVIYFAKPPRPHGASAL